ncbi:MULTISPECIES: hypothetical protein [unclassified Crossiella]|uniref:hypothetical protein n=1 Tax=unclassified Crossiella TaxID=2620835 RepID=UPI001FFE8470|nr:MULTISPECIES: hypothetical protein [unclassified Crossiella]MCK2241819.1 hypothetical protein [Crossiella sp. S99.2]MCK2255722.1 hypothetical protein [Crossiella sp. S99.1]
MKPGRLVLILTLLVVAGLLIWLALSRWDDANKIATTASALGAVASVGIAVWAALRTTKPGGTIRVSGTGKATATGSGSANTGIRGKPNGTAEAKNTGDANSGGGDANTGIRLD